MGSVSKIAKCSWISSEGEPSKTGDRGVSAVAWAVADIPKRCQPGRPASLLRLFLEAVSEAVFVEGLAVEIAAEDFAVVAEALGEEALDTKTDQAAAEAVSMAAEEASVAALLPLMLPLVQVVADVAALVEDLAVHLAARTDLPQMRMAVGIVTDAMAPSTIDLPTAAVAVVDATAIAMVVPADTLVDQGRVGMQTTTAHEKIETEATVVSATTSTAGSDTTTILATTTLGNADTERYLTLMVCWWVSILPSATLRLPSLSVILFHRTPVVQCFEILQRMNAQTRHNHQTGPPLFAALQLYLGKACRTSALSSNMQ